MTTITCDSCGKPIPNHARTKAYTIKIARMDGAGTGNRNLHACTEHCIPSAVTPR